MYWIDRHCAGSDTGEFGTHRNRNTDKHFHGYFNSDTANPNGDSEQYPHSDVHAHKHAHGNDHIHSVPVCNIDSLADVNTIPDSVADADMDSQYHVDAFTNPSNSIADTLHYTIPISYLWPLT